MKCNNCGSVDDFTVMTTMTVSMPFGYFHKLTKKKMQNKEFKIWGVNWENSDFICRKCGNTLFMKEVANGEQTHEHQQKRSNH